MILLRHLRVDAFKHLRNIDLWFPRQGSVLIEGHNESGKSTLFEAIYFALYGRALVGEDSGAPSLEALVPHGEAHARVQLTILAGATELEITRTLTSRPQRVIHDAVVRVHRPGQPVETISAVKAVNDCILAEMNGLDSNVLRNSCLMEQQALDRIESLSRADRELAIAKLLGIEAIQRIEHDLKVATKDSDALAQAQTRLEVARKYAEAQKTRAEAQRVRQALLAAKAGAALAARDSLSARIREVEAQQVEVEREIAQLGERSQRATSLEALHIRSDETAQLLRDAEQAEHALAIMRAGSGALASADISSQLAQADADIKAAEAREHEQRLQVAAARRRARSSGWLAIAAYLAAAAVGVGSLLPQMAVLLLPMFVVLGGAVALTMRWYANNDAVTDGRAKLEMLDREMIRLRARHETVQQFSVNTGKQEQVTPVSLAAQQQTVAATSVNCATALRALADALVQAGIIVPSDSLMLDSVAQMRRGHETLARALQAEMARLDVPATQQQYGTLGEIERQARAKRDELTAQRDEARQRLVTALAEAGIAATGDEPMDTVVADWPALAHAGDPDALAAALAHTSAIEGQLRQEVEALCQQYGFDAETLDAVECQKAVDDLAREQRQRRLAAEMADEVFRRIVQRVLPETEMHMRALLPDLTDGRYRDVTLLGGDENSADLRIRVWDEQAGRYVGKHLFSGGTRDQCSLALRLAFALATLPKELGAMPGFIFLDEPLSSFDDRRSQALVEVLTRGPIAKQFPQVFLISHSQSFDPAAFTCTLRMAGGRVASSTLPDEATARALWEPGLTPATQT
ncbi:MAG TPA: AAA family ATPase, partial [Ktedonobacterales bacterium]|nr:AAA family ATPase [Ktedonobacterales bacterium]